MLKEILDFCCITFGCLFAILAVFEWLCFELDDDPFDLAKVLPLLAIGSLLFIAAFGRFAMMMLEM